MPVGNTAQKRAIKNYRSRLVQRGIARFEIQALKTDRELIRALVKKLLEGPKANQVRRTMQQVVSGELSETGNILAALRRSPLVGANLDLSRSFEEGRKVDL